MDWIGVFGKFYRRKVPETDRKNELYAPEPRGDQDPPEPAAPQDPKGDERLRAGMLETLGALAQGVSRDLQTGLQVILDHTLRLKSRVDVTTSALGELLAVETAARRLLQVSGPLSDLARQTSPDESLNLNAIIRNVMPLVQAVRGGKPAFSLELEPRLPVLRGTYTLAAHAFITLFLRAAREMPHGGTIRVRTGRMAASEAETLGLAPCEVAAWVAIKDESPGYAPEHRDHILRSLRDNRRCDEPEIAFLQEVLLKHEGRAVLESQPGRGSTWTLYFPASGDGSEEAAFACPTDVSRCRGTILLVDDEPLICGVGRRVLETAGYLVLTAFNGTQAIDTYRRHLDEVDLVLLDVILPDQGGLEVLKAIRGMNKSARILISSGYTTEGGIREILEENGVGFIQKPYRIKELLTKVEVALMVSEQRTEN